MLKSHLLKSISTFIAFFAFAAVFHLYFSDAESAKPSNYTRLLEFIQIQDLKTPLYVFKDYEEGFDTDSHKANLEYLNSNPDLIKRIRADLAGAPLRWRLKMLRHRLLFVPEKRKEFAALYENYCKDIIRFVLSKTNFENPFCDILTLDRERPVLTSHTDGVVVFLVHNLAKEFQATNLFVSQKEKKAELKLKGKIFIGNIGSYASQIEFLENGDLNFSSSNYSIWQNSADNPYTALMTPVEETLHILLRPYTETAVKQRVSAMPQQSITVLQAVADEWIAVEEAVAGGLTHWLLPVFFKTHIPDLSASLIESDLESKIKLKKYKYLRSGIMLVETIGYKEVLYRYQSTPNEIRRLLQDYQS